jgi:hypothetical protein
VDGRRHERDGSGAAGGIIRHDIIEEAAKIALAGMDPIKFLRTDDDVERIALQAIAQRIFEIRAEEARQAKQS